MSQARAVPSRAAEVWSHVNLMFGRTKHNHQTPHDAGSLNSINDHFQTVAIGPSHKSAVDFVVPQSSAGKDSFGFVEISVDLVLTLLQTLDPKKSTGPDGLSARFLREVAAEIATPLTNLYNASLSCGKFPSDWKRSHITPVHEGGNMEDPSNFCPIAVVPVLAKVLERIVLMQVGWSSAHC